VSRRADVLMITYRSAGYVGLSLSRLLETCGEDDRVWLWHNGDDEATLEALRPFLDHPAVARFHHSRDNVRLRPPTQWLWASSGARYVAKVDDDCVVSPGWIDTFAAAHEANPSFGVVCSWRHPAEDFRPDLAQLKIVEFAGGHRLMLNHWVQGSGYLLPRRWLLHTGTLRETETFTGFCLRLARLGAVNGYYYPFVFEDHMDDPRSPHTLISTDADLRARMPLSAQVNGVTTVAAWQAQLERSAVLLQSASTDLRYYAGWRKKVRSARRRVRALAGDRSQW
jgi:hypothetical protein